MGWFPNRPRPSCHHHPRVSPRDEEEYLLAIRSRYASAASVDRVSLIGLGDNLCGAIRDYGGDVSAVHGGLANDTPALKAALFYAAPTYLCPEYADQAIDMPVPDSVAPTARREFLMFRRAPRPGRRRRRPTTAIVPLRELLVSHRSTAGTPVIARDSMGTATVSRAKAELLFVFSGNICRRTTGATERQRTYVFSAHSHQGMTCGNAG